MSKFNKVVYFFFLIILVNSLILNALGKSENEHLLSEQREIYGGIELFQENKIDESVIIFEKYKESKYKDSYIFNLYFARVLNEKERYDLAIIHYKLAYNIQPRLLLEQEILNELMEIEVKNVEKK